jgi:hypothetical protein
LATSVKCWAVDLQEPSPFALRSTVSLLLVPNLAITTCNIFLPRCTRKTCSRAKCILAVGARGAHFSSSSISFQLLAPQLNFVAVWRCRKLAVVFDRLRRGSKSPASYSMRSPRLTAEYLTPIAACSLAAGFSAQTRTLLRSTPSLSFISSQ